MNILRNFLNQRQQQLSPKIRPQRNICYGIAKPINDSATEMLAADVSLVASGVGKGCTPDKLKYFLEERGIHAVEVEMLTKPEVVKDVRTLTFRVAVKPKEYKDALKPEVWPYRVGVRHYRAPRRYRSDRNWEGQSRRSGGQVNRTEQARGNGGGLNGNGVGPRRGSGSAQFLPTGHAGRVQHGQQLMQHQQPGPVDLKNFFSVLSAMGGDMDIPPNQ